MDKQLKTRKTRLLLPEQNGVREAVTYLRAGQLVALPTETVYGLSARADDPDAVRSIFEAKGRPANHPLIVHVHTVEAFSFWAKQVPEVVLKLAKVFCPGPLTFILPLHPERDRTVTGGQDWVGLRIPSHPLALEVLAQCGFGVGAPSANRFGRISPTSSQDVMQELEGYIDAILDGGVCEVGIESTIIKVEEACLTVLRPGHIRPEALEKVAECPVVRPLSISLSDSTLHASPLSSLDSSSPSLRVSGQLDSHYAPIKPAYYVPLSQITQLAPIWGEHDWVMLRSSVPEQVKHTLQKQGVALGWMPDDPITYAKKLYARLREGDLRSTIQRIWVLELPDGLEWDAIRDRVGRATKIV